MGILNKTIIPLLIKATAYKVKEVSKLLKHKAIDHH